MNYSDMQGNSRNYHGRQSNYSRRGFHDTERAAPSELYRSELKGNSRNYERSSDYPEKQSQMDRDRFPPSEPYRSESRGNNQDYNRPSNYPEKQSNEMERERFLPSGPYRSEYRGNGQNHERPSNYPEKQSHDVERKRFSTGFGSVGNSQNYERPSNYPEKQSHDINREGFPGSSEIYRSETRGIGRNYERPSNYPEQRSHEVERERFSAISKPDKPESRENIQNYEIPFNYPEKQSHEIERERFPASSEPNRSGSRGSSRNYNRPSNYPEKQPYDMETDTLPPSSNAYDADEYERRVYTNPSTYQQTRSMERESATPSSKYLKQPYDMKTETFPSSSNVYDADEYQRRVYKNPSTYQEKRSFERERESATPSSKYLKQETGQTFGSPSNYTHTESFDIKREFVSTSIKSETAQKQSRGQQGGRRHNYPQKESFGVKRESVPISSSTYGSQIEVKSEYNYPQQQSYEPTSRGRESPKPNFSALFDIPQQHSHNRESTLDKRESHFNPRHSFSDRRGNPYQQKLSKGGYGSANNRPKEKQQNKFSPSEKKSGNLSYTKDSHEQAQRNLVINSSGGERDVTIQTHDHQKLGVCSKFQQDVEQTGKQSWYEEVERERLGDDYQVYEECGDSEGKYEDVDHCEDTEQNDDVDQDEGAVQKSTQLYIPSKEVITKFTFYPPSAEHMANMFKDIVIFFLFKTAKVKLETNPFVIICESFRRSSSYHNLSVEDGISTHDRSIRFCTLRYCQMMMVRGMSSFGITKEARVKAGIKLINNLSQLCYSLKMKPDYYNNDGLKRCLDEKERKGVFKVIPDEEVSNDERHIQELLERFFKVDTDCELIFTSKPQKIRSVAKRLNLHIRKIGNNCTGVSKIRTTQYWRDLLLSRGQMENEKFILVPPQGIGNQLIKGTELQDLMKSFQKRMVGPAITEDELKLYGPKGEGPTIQSAGVSWGRGGRGRRGGGGGRGRGRGNDPFFSGGLSKSNRFKMNKVKQCFAEGQNIFENKNFLSLPQRLKKRIRGNVEGMN